MHNITSRSHAHMIAQVRIRQLAIKDSQNLLQQKIIAVWKENKEISGEKFGTNVEEKLYEMYKSSLHINETLEKYSIDQIGYPIKNNKTHLQLKMAHKWVQEKEDNLLGDIEKNKLYHDLTNRVDTDLPRLQSPSETIFWGNENPSVSSILLASVASVMGIKKQTMMAGCALYYPFYDTKCTLDNIPESYPFASKKKIWLFGDYQFGGQRYLKKSEKSLFGPLDCSEAVANSTHLSHKQQLNFSTKDIREAFSKENNEYKYIPITSTKKNFDFNLIQSGDIYLHKGHTAIITDIDNKGKIGTIEFNRDIDRPTRKILGGGTYSYDLIAKARDVGNDPFNQIYILRDSHPPLKESYTCSDLINKIDNLYYKWFDNKPKDKPGDCSIFIDKNFWGTETSTKSCCLPLC